MKRIVFLLSLALVLVGFPASAATITFGDQVLASGYSLIPVTGDFTLSQFDPSLGTLQSVSLVYTVYWDDVAGTVYNGGTADAEYQAEGRMGSTLTGATISSQYYITALYIDPVSGWNLITPGETQDLDIGGNESGSQTQAPITPGPLSAFIGLGTVSYHLVIDNDTLLHMHSGGELTYAQTATGMGTLDIFYTFDDDSDVPEPATAAIAGFGLLALGFLSRRSARR